MVLSKTTTRLICPIFIFYEKLLNRTSFLSFPHQIIHHMLHRVNLPGPVGIASAEQERMLRIPLSRLHKSHGDTVWDSPYIAVLQALETGFDGRAVPGLNLP